MGFKSLIILCGFICLVRNEDLLLGNAEGKKIFEEEEKASPTIWRQIQNVTVNATMGEVIGKILITDLRPDKKGEAKIVEGGVGHENVTIELKSPTALRGYEFHIEVFTVPESEGKNLFEVPRTNLDPITKTADNSDNVQVPAEVAEETKDGKINYKHAASTTLPNNNGDVKIYEVTPKIDLQNKMDAKTDTKREAVETVSETLKRESTSANPLNTPTKLETLITIEDASKMGHHHAHSSPMPSAFNKNVVTPKSLENKESMEIAEDKDRKDLTHPLFNIHQSTQAPISSTSGLPVSTTTSKLNEKRETIDKDLAAQPDNQKLPSTKQTPIHLAKDKVDFTTEKVNQLAGSKSININSDSQASTHKPVQLM